MPSSIDPKVIVLHALRPSSRKTTIDHVVSLSEISGESNVAYLHFSNPLTPDILNMKSDIFIVNYDFLNYRFTPMWDFVKDRYKQVAQRAQYRVAIVQDDFWAHLELDDWISDWNIDRVLTPIESNLDSLYPKSIGRCEFRTVLTGYAPKLKDCGRAKPLYERDIDLGQRVRHMSPSLGSYAEKKALQAINFAALAEQKKFVVDVSADPKDALLGNQWAEFLANSRFTVSMKGGASLADPRGLIHHKVNRYLNLNPDATFDDVEKNCFPGLDGRHVYSAISPRLFEAAAAGTCQILQEDDYLGVLEPWVHYLPLSADLSNSEEILEAMRDLQKCQRIADACFETLIASGDFTHENLIRDTISGLTLRESDVLNDKSFHSGKNYIVNLGKVQTKHSTELHDATWAFLYDLELMNSRRKIKSFRKTLSFKPLNKEAISKCFKKLRHTSLPASLILLFDLIEIDQTDWLIQRLNEIERKQTLKIQVWTWRSLPQFQVGPE